MLYAPLVMMLMALGNPKHSHLQRPKHTFKHNVKSVAELKRPLARVLMALGNPKHRHPQGPKPASKHNAKAVAELKRLKDYLADGANVLVDANNVYHDCVGHVTETWDTMKDQDEGRGYNISAEGLTKAISAELQLTCLHCNNASSRPFTAVVWDSERPIRKPKTPPWAARMASGNSAVIFGESSTADTVIVQLCAYLEKSDLPLVIFTSDFNLAGRVALQSQRAQVFHSLYLIWLLEDVSSSFADNDERLRLYEREAESSVEIKKQFGLFKSRVWKHTRLKEKRARQRKEALGSLKSRKALARQEDATLRRSVEAASVVRWFNGGCKGLSLGRVTKGGSILYDFDGKQSGE